MTSKNDRPASNPSRNACFPLPCADTTPSPVTQDPPVSIPAPIGALRRIPPDATYPESMHRAGPTDKTSYSIPAWQRQGYAGDGPSRVLAIDKVHPSAVLGDDAAAKDQSDARTLRPGGIERHEEILRIGDTRAVVHDLEFALSGVDRDPQDHGQHGVGGIGRLLRLHRVAQEVDQDLFQVHHIAQQLDVRHPAFHDHAIGREHSGDLLHEARHGKQRLARFRKTRDARVYRNERFQSHRPFADQGKSIPQHVTLRYLGRTLEDAVERLAKRNDRRERIVDFMAYHANEPLPHTDFFDGQHLLHIGDEDDARGPALLAIGLLDDPPAPFRSRKAMIEHLRPAIQPDVGKGRIAVRQGRSTLRRYAQKFHGHGIGQTKSARRLEHQDGDIDLVDDPMEDTEQFLTGGSL
ncbi:hypothetical protein KCV01_g7952, partial [Aureobasidium melanogenum]